ncbi:MerR family transcriptional regulator [Paenibacillus polymyxa]|uniref:MerR family transcriptional regulator n=1 Tax=Paenibacillus polymyxa TaxID=1406 RepID=A0A8I1IMT0_PAEPO|nr:MULTISPECIES: MerR family transcriptional regulator [Paenibacillus]KAF6574997.1 MerR family transcriptional regulator [Paenibacillus sp. EKM206P]KAF6590329.1 MerR family transcriptional regulator [Paenibacillus sp. EKM205P]MBM0632311.1 MerR family transcriptional regulator [Paenibacillus polymyxa]
MKEEHIFTIKQTAKQTGISEDTIRYYEKIALLPRADRKDNGHRIYRKEDINTIRLISCLKKTGMPLEEMRPFLAVSADADPAEYPELVEHLRSHRENMVSQIASLQQVVDFIDMKLEEGRYRGDCSEEFQDGMSEKMMGEPKAKPVSPVEMSYFSASANGGKSPISVR